MVPAGRLPTCDWGRASAARLARQRPALGPALGAGQRGWSGRQCKRQGSLPGAPGALTHKSIHPFPLSIDFTIYKQWFHCIVLLEGSELCACCEAAETKGCCYEHAARKAQLCAFGVHLRTPGQCRRMA